jgi:hypothetical protein
MTLVRRAGDGSDEGLGVVRGVVSVPGVVDAQDVAAIL